MDQEKRETTIKATWKMVTEREETVEHRCSCAEASSPAWMHAVECIVFRVWNSGACLIVEREAVGGDLLHDALRASRVEHILREASR